ncbi:MAG: M81 family metallopeptidase [Novipirellula sp. JB048]
MIPSESDSITNAKPRVLIAGLFHESHSFVEGPTRWSEMTVYRDGELLELRGDASPMGGVLKFAAAEGWDVLPTIYANATPGPTLDDDVLENFWSEFRPRAVRFGSDSGEPASSGIDGIFLVLHGASVSCSVADVEGELLARIRGLEGFSALPLFGVYDLHANFSDAMAQHADCLVGYRENPHRDARASSIRAAKLLSRSLRSGVRPRQIVSRPGIVWPPTGTATASEPMATLLRKARQLERDHPDFWAISVNAGFSFADTADTGVSFLISTAGELPEAASAIESLQAIALENASVGNVSDTPIPAVMEQLEQLKKLGQLDGLTLLVEPADNIGGGAPGSGITMLRVLIEAGYRGVGVCLWDPPAVEVASRAKLGEVITLQLGGRGSRLLEPPITLHCELLHHGDGLFELEDKQSHLASCVGDHFDMGRVAVVRATDPSGSGGEAIILLTTHRTPPMDLGCWRHVGIDPENFSLMPIKAAVSHRQAYDPIAKRQFWVETPGPCSSRLESFSFQNLTRPIYPLDPLAEVTGGRRAVD